MEAPQDDFATIASVLNWCYGHKYTDEDNSFKSWAQERILHRPSQGGCHEETHQLGVYKLQNTDFAETIEQIWREIPPHENRYLRRQDWGGSSCRNYSAFRTSRHGTEALLDNPNFAIAVADALSAQCSALAGRCYGIHL